MNERMAVELLTNGHRDPRALGFIDDAALVGDLVVSQDMLVEDVDFRRRTFSAADIGHKALAVNLSDLAAMGAHPVGFVQALALPQDIDETWLRDYAAGVRALSERTGCVLLGGDLSGGASIVISITVLGRTATPLRRGLARAGDRLCVGGVLGSAAAGLAALEGGYAAPAALLLAQRRPEPQLALGLTLAAHPSVHGAMDVSDGLAADLPRFLPHGLGACLEEARLPVAPELVGDARATAWALRGGEDYVLLAAVAPGVSVPGLFDIGSVDTTGVLRWRDRQGAEHPLGAGFDHLRARHV